MRIAVSFCRPSKVIIGAHVRLPVGRCDFFQADQVIQVDVVDVEFEVVIVVVEIVEPDWTADGRGVDRAIQPIRPVER